MVRNPLADIRVSYPSIEKLIDTEDFTQVNEDFSKLYDGLEVLSKKKGGLGAAKQAKIGMKGVEKVMDLLEEFLKLKYRLMAGTGAEKTKASKK